MEYLLNFVRICFWVWGFYFFYYYYFIFFFLSFLSVKLSGLRNKTKDHRGIDFQAQRY